MLNHFKHNSKRSFDFNEKRLLNLAFEDHAGELEFAGELDPDQKNERINEDFNGFDNKVEEELGGISISKATRRTRNMFEQLRELFKDEGNIDNQLSRQFAAEFTDALSDNDAYMERFKVDGIRNPYRVFSATSINNGQLTLITKEGTDFSINLNELRSEWYGRERQRQQQQNNRAIRDSQIARRSSLIDETEAHALDLAGALAMGDHIASDAFIDLGIGESSETRENADIEFIIENLLEVRDRRLNQISRNFLIDEFHDILAASNRTPEELLRNNPELRERTLQVALQQAGMSSEEYLSRFRQTNADIAQDVIADAADQITQDIDTIINEIVLNTDYLRHLDTNISVEAINFYYHLIDVTDNDRDNLDLDSIRQRLIENEFDREAGLNYVRQLRGQRAPSSSTRGAEQAPTSPRERADRQASNPDRVQRSLSPIDIEVREGMEIDTQAQFDFYQQSIDGALSHFDSYRTFDLPADFQNNYSQNALRLLLTSGRVRQADIIITELSDLGVTLDELHTILEFRNGNQEDGISINVGNILMQSPFYINRRGIRQDPDTQLQIFLQETQSLLQNRNELTPEERQELVARLSYYQRMDSVIGRLVNLELVDTSNGLEELDTSLDNIRRVDFSQSVRRELSRRIPDLDVTRSDNHLEKVLMAYYIYAYGPLDRLMSNDQVDLSLSSFSEGRIVQNNRRDNQFILEVNDIPTSHIDRIAELFNNNGGVDLLTAEVRERNLTDALNSIRRSEGNYQNVREAARLTRLGEMGPNPSTQELSFHHLAQIFDLNAAGMMLRRGRGTVSPIDQIGGAIPDGENLQDFLGERVSDLSMYHFIADEMGVRVDFENMNTENLASTLNLYQDMGQATISLINPTLATENPEVFSAITNAASFTVENLNDPNYTFSQGQIDAIRYGILFEAQRDDAMARAQEAVNESGEELNNEMYMELAQYWASNRNIPAEAVPILARQSYGILSTIDFTDGIENTRFGAGALINLSLGAYRNEDGEWEVGVQMPNDARSWIQFTGGNVLNESMVRTPGNFIEGFSVGVEVGHRFKRGGALTAGVNGGAWGFSVYAGARSPEGRRGWAFEAGGGFNSVTGGFARAGVGRSIDGVINTNIERAIENSEFAELFKENGRFSPELVMSIANGETSAERILEIANQSETLSELLEDARSQIESNPELAARIGNIDAILNAAKVNYITAIATAITNEGIRDIGAFLSTAAIAFTTNPPFIIPIIGITAGGNRRVYPGGISSSQARGRSGVLMAQQIAEAAALGSEDQAITIHLDGSTVTTNAEGNFVALEIFAQDTNFLEEAEARTSAIDHLNEHTATTGMTFEQVANNDNYQWAFRLNQNDLSSYGLGYSTEILTDRYSGITVEHLGGGQFGVRWGSNPDTPPPGDLVLTREGIIDDNGYNPTVNVISFSRGSYVPSNVIANGPMANPVIHVDENGNVTEDDGSHRYSRTLDLAEYQRPELEVADYQFSTILAEARRSEAMFAASENMLSMLEYDRGSVIDIDSVDPEVSDFVSNLLQDDEFIQEFADATTIDSDGRPDFNSVSNLINNKFQERFGRDAADGEMAFILSQLMPNTFLTVERLNPSDRLDEVVRVATEVTSLVVREVAADVNYPGDIDSLAQAITSYAETSIRNNEALATALQQNPITTETLTEALEGNLNVATAFTVAAWSNMGTRGLRQLIFDPSSTSPEVVQGSVTEFNLSDPEQAQIADFLDYLYEQPAGEIDLNNPEFVTTEAFEEVMLSRSATQLLTLTLDTENGQRLSLINFLIGDVASVEYITSILEKLRNGEPITDIPSGDNLTAIRFVTENIMNLMSASHGTESITLTNPEDASFSIEIPLEVNSGTMLRYPCANLSFYYDRVIDSQAEIILPQEYSIISGRSTYQTLGRAGRDALSTTGSVDLAMMFDLGLDRTGKVDATAFDEEDVQYNEDGEAYIEETSTRPGRPRGPRRPFGIRRPRPNNTPGGLITGDDNVEIGSSNNPY